MSLLSIFLSLSVSAAALQQPSVLDALRQNYSQECVQVDYQFSALSSGVRSVGEGSVDIQGNTYHMCGNGMEIFCDGKTTWLLDTAAKEVIIEAADSNSSGFLANPVILLMNLEKSALSYKAEGNRIHLELPDGTSLEITIMDLKTADAKKPEAFRPPVEFGSDWIVTDLR